MAVITVDLSKIIENLQAELRKHRDEADQIVARVTTENRDFTKDEEEALTAHQQKIVSINKRIDLIKKQAETRGEADAPGSSRTRRDSRGTGERENAAIPGLDDDEDDDIADTREAKRKQNRYAQVYDKWLRRGMVGMSAEEQNILQSGYRELDANNAEVRAMSAFTGSTGGFTVPQGFISDVERAMKEFSGVRKSRASVISTESGNDVPWPTVNDTANEGEMVSENTSLTEDTGPSVLGQVTLKGFLFSSKLILIPITLLQDSGINIQGLVTDLLGERLGRITNRKFTTGTGANEPQGIVTGSALGVTAAGAAAITYDETIDLQHSVDPAYRAQAEYMFHDSALKLFRKLKDSDGRPIWMPSMTAGMASGAPGTLNGSPYVINQNMDAPATGKKSVLFGDMSKYRIREIRNMVLVRLTERYAEKLQTGFFAFVRADGRHVNAGSAIKHLVHP